MYIYIYINIYIYIYIYIINVYICIYTYMYTDIHTYIHIYALSPSQANIHAKISKTIVPLSLESSRFAKQKGTGILKKT